MEAQSECRVDVSQVRSSAAVHGWLEVHYNPAKQALVFQRDQNETDGSLYRLDVYYSTGTVSVALYHPIGTVSRIYKRTVDGEKLLEVMSNPHAVKGRTIVTMTKPQDRILEVDTNLDDELLALQNYSKFLREELESIEDEKAEVEAHLRRMVETRDQKKDASTRAKEAREAAREKKRMLNQEGSSVLFSLRDHAMEFCKQNNTSDAVCVSLSDGLLAIDDKGVPFYTGNLPRLLSNRLRKAEDRVAFACLGAGEQYYVRFLDGEERWSGPATFNSALARGGVFKVAMGGHSSWWVQYDDGSFVHENLPTALLALLKKKDCPKVRDVHLGPLGTEWFVRFETGVWRAGGYAENVTDALEEIAGEGGVIKHIMFGEKDSYYIRFTHVD